MGVDEAASGLIALLELSSGGSLTWRRIPEQQPRYADWPRAVDPRVVAALGARGIERPYTHQARAIAGALEGRDQVVVTPTASGKTLCYSVPVLSAILEDPSARALYLFPTKALAQDQLQELRALADAAGGEVSAETYDGDTTPRARRAARVAGHVVITNPDMLHSGILPHHTKWVRLFEHLRYVVVDELHSYRGVFGSHVANVLRRLRRICRFYGSDPVFICCSATIANPDAHAAALVGRAVDLVDDSGAPSGERLVALYNPPIVNPQLGIRRGVPRATTEVLARLQAEDVQTIVFAGSRSRVELLTQYAREQLGPRHSRIGATDAVRGYRSGYLPKERRAIEAGLRDGTVRTVVATNALELGIDIGGLDAAVIAGYPGTLASLRQQMGRAGRRRGRALAILVAGSGPLDQYVVAHPEYAFEATVEAALIQPRQPARRRRAPQVRDLRAAARARRARRARPADRGHARDPRGRRGSCIRAGDRTYWSSEAYPAAEISLRHGAQQNVVIVDQGPPVEVIGEVDRPSAMTLVHDEAIYVHDGRQYHVDRLDWEELKAYVRPVDVDYYTDANLAVDLRVLREEDASAARPGAGPAGATQAHGEVAVTYLATLFKKIKLHTHENVGWGKIRLPQDDLHSTAYWLTLPNLAAGPRPVDPEAALLGVGQLLRHVAPLLLMSEPADLQLAIQVKSPHTGEPTLFLWESVPGGVGFSQRLFDVGAQLLDLAREVIEGCACLEGCPRLRRPAGRPRPGREGAHARAAARSHRRRRLARHSRTGSPRRGGCLVTPGCS